jgi:hypothetical protein
MNNLLKEAGNTGKAKVSLVIVLSVFIGNFLMSCLSLNDNEDKDRTEEVMLTVASKKVDFYPFENIGIPSEGISVKEDNANYWTSFPLTAIEGFVYEEGYEYRLKVRKIHLANPPEDGFRFKYKLITVVSSSLL